MNYETLLIVGNDSPRRSAALGEGSGAAQFTGRALGPEPTVNEIANAAVQLLQTVDPRPRAACAERPRSAVRTELPFTAPAPMAAVNIFEHDYELPDLLKCQM